MNVNCTVCNKEFQRRPYHIKKTKYPFCSFQCYGEWQKINRKGQNKKEPVFVKCSTCGNTKQIYPHLVNQARHFCNRKCEAKWKSIYQSGENNPAWLGGHKQYRGNNWKQQTEIAKKRDGYKCQKCGDFKSLVVHHIKPYHSFTNYMEANKLHNLITLCTKCHGVEEFVLIKTGGHKNRQFPNTAITKTCKKCGKDFFGSPRSDYCIPCCTFKCKKCGKKFISRRKRNVLYCSLECFHSYPHPILCGKKTKHFK